ncbi:Acyltransferase [Daejeonella rubra]|uniref:Acyltransferase n=1 Tax=Daejeonella rubra TaxID=990371 RepID=A0A1G9Z398_9SPHI|nr:1-acyl-sn-glycerol-3-phosphate acyltransferase [Daejeonella rubra]SDN15928.1 Acyltransferase [Daejeonella rubra]
MIIKAKPLPARWLYWGIILIVKFARRRFNKMVIYPIDIKPNHSYLLMCNHFSFWDGVIAAYLGFNAIYTKDNIKCTYIMVLKKQLQKNNWLRYFGAFSISPYGRSVNESLDYAAEILSVPGNILLFFPQGNLESSHVREIVFKEGLSQIIPQIKGDCQLIWSSNIPEYFESLKPSIYFNMLDCGTNHNFNLEELKAKVNDHHRKSIRKNFRFTEEADL